MLGTKLLRVSLEKFGKLLRTSAGKVVEGYCGDIIRLSFAYQRVVLKNVLFLRIVGIGLGFQYSLGFGSDER